MNFVCEYIFTYHRGVKAAGWRCGKLGLKDFKAVALRCCCWASCTSPGEMIFCAAVIDSAIICRSPANLHADPHADLLDIVTLTRYERVHQTAFLLKT